MMLDGTMAGNAVVAITEAVMATTKAEMAATIAIKKTKMAKAEG